MRAPTMLGVALAVACTLSDVGCLDATAIDVSVYSQVPCSTRADVALSLASDNPKLSLAPTSSVATQCIDVGDGTVRRGNVVLTPQGDRSKLVAFRLTTRNDDQPTDACTTDVHGCIVATRELHFREHTTMSVRVDLRLTCLGVTCPAGQTCVKGACVGDVIDQCGVSCDESALTPSDAGAPDASVGPSAVLAAGDYHTCALLTDQTVKCWGRNEAGEIGDGTMTDRPKPFAVPLHGTVRAIGAAYGTSCAALQMSGVMCWGSGNKGQLGNNTGGGSTTPVPAKTTETFSALGGGLSNMCGATAAGALYCWGASDQAQSGATSGNLIVPTLLPSYSGVLGVTGSAFVSCAYSASDVRCWGNGMNQALGNGMAIRSAVPVVVTGLSQVRSLAARATNTCAVLQDGTVQCWTAPMPGTPVAVPGLTDAVSVAVGIAHVCVLRAGGGVSCWGDNSQGQLGQPPNVPSSASPMAVPGVAGATSIVTGEQFSCAGIGGNAVMCWGDNHYAQLGDGTLIQRFTPMPVIGL